MKNNIDPETLRHRRQLAAWLHEWNLEQHLRRVDIDERGDLAEGDLPAPTPHAYPRPGDIAPGRILLLPPRRNSRIDRPIYVLMLAEMESGACLIAPFSRFSVPALPGEWRTGLRAAPLRVLCLWNTRGAVRGLLEAGWPAARMSAMKLKQAFAICQGIWQSDAHTSSPSRNVGPPLRHPLDPRHGYISEETDLLDAATAIEANANGREPARRASTALNDWKPEALRLAAEQKAHYGRK